MVCVWSVHCPERMQDEPDYAELCRRYLADRQDFSEEKLAEAGIDRRYENLDLDKCCLKLSAP